MECKKITVDFSSMNTYEAKLMIAAINHRKSGGTSQNTMATFVMDFLSVEKPYDETFLRYISAKKEAIYFCEKYNLLTRDDIYDYIESHEYTGCSELPSSGRRIINCIPRSEEEKKLLDRVIGMNAQARAMFVFEQYNTFRLLGKDEYILDLIAERTMQSLTKLYIDNGNSFRGEFEEIFEAIWSISGHGFQEKPKWMSIDEFLDEVE